MDHGDWQREITNSLQLSSVLLFVMCALLAENCGQRFFSAEICTIKCVENFG